MHLNNIGPFITDPAFRFSILASRGFYDKMPDEEFLRRKFKLTMGYELDLENPRTLCEKLQWLKLYDRRPEYTVMVDKVKAKDYVAGIIGEEHVIQTLGVWDDPDDINFDALTDKFVIKPNHDSGGLVICKDKSSLDIEKAKEQLRRALKRDYFRGNREWLYKDVERKLFAEPLVEQLGRKDSVEYKVSCFNGQVRFITICTGIAHARFDDRFNDHFDKDFNKLDWFVNYRPAPQKPQKPEQWGEMISIAEKLSEGIPYLRVDMYVIDNKVIFGEMTFYTWGGFMHFEPPEWDAKLGDWLTLPEKR